MKTGNRIGVICALATGLLLSHQAFADCSDGNCTAVSLTNCSEDDDDDENKCHTGYFIGYKCAGTVTYHVSIYNAPDQEHELSSSGPNSVKFSIKRWNLTKDAYVEEMSCCNDDTDCTDILDESILP